MDKRTKDANVDNAIHKLCSVGCKTNKMQKK